MEQLAFTDLDPLVPNRPTTVTVTPPSYAKELEFAVPPTKSNIELAEHYMGLMMQCLGFGPETSEHLQDTPRRVVKMYLEMFTPQEWKFTTFSNGHHDPGGQGDPGIVLVRDIPFTSMCAHHLLPFTGRAHVAYIPQSTYAGLSKLARTIELFSAKPSVQEEIGIQAADYLMAHLNPLGVAVILTAEHSCMSIRGAEAHGSKTTTSALRGVFFSDARARAELYQLLRID